MPRTSLPRTFFQPPGIHGTLTLSCKLDRMDLARSRFGFTCLLLWSGRLSFAVTVDLLLLVAVACSKRHFEGENIESGIL